MALNNASNVSAGKPAIGGAIFVAPLGTAVPTNAIDTLDSAFVNVGYISEDGLVNSNSPTTEGIKAWGGDTVYNTLTDKEDTWKFTMIEITNTDALKVVYGSANVSGDLTNGITIRANNAETEEVALVADMVLRGKHLKRVVIPRAQVTEVGDISYVDNDVVGYETTMAAHPDEVIGYDTHREYIVTTEPESE